MRRLILSLAALGGLVLFLPNLWGTDFEIKLPKTPEPETVFWVAPDGNDAASGDEAHPFATLARSAEAVRSALTETPEKSVAVYFQAGTYPLTGTAELTNICASAEKPVIFRSAPGAAGKVILSGTKPVTGWEKLSESEFWKNASDEFKARIRPDAVDKIYIADYTPFVTKRFAPAQGGGRQEFFADDKPQQIARWPNEGFAVAGKAVGETPVTSWAQKGTKEGIFEAAEDQPDGWEKEKNVYLFSYWFWDWSDSIEQMQSIAATEEGRKIITLTGPYSGYGYKDNLRYYGFNLLCELDAPNEYYIDRESNRIFWIPAGDPNQITAKIDTLENDWAVSVKDCKNLIFAGLTFDGGFGGAMNIENCDSFLLADTNIFRFGKNALRLFGGKESGLYNCRLETLGFGGIEITGGDRKTLTEANHFISNTVVHNFSRIKRTYAPAALVTGCGIKIDHCDFSESSSSALRLEGNEFLIEYNRFTELVKESDDQGGIDVYWNPTYRGNAIRYNYWENIIGGTKCGAAGVRFDDMISGYTVYGNLFINCGAVHFGAVQIHGGKENLVENNVFYKCAFAVSFSPWGDGYTKAFTDPENHNYAPIKKKCHEDVDIDSPVWRERYPELEHIAENADVNTVRTNLIVNCPERFQNKRDCVIEENNTDVALPDEEKAKITDPDYLAGFGLEPIPVDQMGVTGAAYLEN